MDNNLFSIPLLTQNIASVYYVVHCSVILLKNAYLGEPPVGSSRGLFEFGLWTYKLY